MAKRIRGQESEVIFISENQPVTTITDIRSTEITPQLEIQEEEYLGETTVRLDEIFKGCRGRLSMHIENDDILGFITTIINRAKRRLPGVRINLKTTLNFDNGDRPRVILRDLAFGEAPLNIASRSDFIEVSLDFKSSDIDVI